MMAESNFRFRCYRTPLSGAAMRASAMTDEVSQRVRKGRRA